MSQLFDAANNMTKTTNGMTALKSTMSPLVDLFAKIGTSRGEDMSKLFDKAFKADADKAVRMALWARDIRGGAGERQRFRDLLVHMAKTLDKDTVVKVINKVPELGRYDDLHVLIGTDYEDIALQLHIDGIKAGNGLAAKWAPRKGAVAAKLRSVWGVTPKFYRKTIVELTNVVEQKMCAGKWDEIEFSHVPSQASRIYSQAFRRHSGEKYSTYLERVMKGEATMNAGAVFPDEILRKCYTDAKQADAQWKSLPNYLEGVDESILCVCDVSGSMMGKPMEISVALGLYFSERLEGIFKDCVVTFSESPDMVKLKGGTLSQRINELKQINWGMSTNLEAVFDLVLKAAKAHNLPQDQLPTKILIMSDMQFNSCIRNSDDTAIQMIEKKFEAAGYNMPSLIFWNIDGGNMPATFNAKGVGLVSGSSPSTIKAVLGGDIDPVRVMLNAIMQDRYAL